MALALWMANYFTQQAYDRSLLDDAYSVAANVKFNGQTLDLVLSASEMGTVLFDQSESVYFAVERPDGSLVAGHTGLRGPVLAKGQTFEFGDTIYQGRSLRVVTLRRTQPTEFSVVVAQTTNSRTALLQRLVAYSIAPQIALLAILAWRVRRAIQSDLEPLSALQRAVDQRDASDLTALAPALISGARSLDVERLGMAIDSLLERVRTGVRAQREFAGSVAHELRTPLAGIRALAEYGLAQSRPEIWREQLRDIVRSEARASHLIDQLLALALADEARTSLALEPVALVDVIRRTILQFLPRADAAGVDFGARGLEQPVVVRAHTALVEGLLGNLIDNALRYGVGVPERSPRLTVALSLETGPQGEPCARLSVVDNGPGLPSGEARALTQRWARGVAATRLAQGSGLGLAIVKRYAELMNAELQFTPAAEDYGLRASVIFRDLISADPLPSSPFARPGVPPSAP